MSDPTKPLKSGDKVKTADGGEAELPYANEHPCFGQRQGWCTNMATWRRDTSHTMLHFCDACKRSKPQLSPDGSTWTQLDVRTTPKPEPKEQVIVEWTTREVQTLQAGIREAQGWPQGLVHVRWSGVRGGLCQVSDRIPRTQD